MDELRHRAVEAMILAKLGVDDVIPPTTTHRMPIGPDAHGLSLVTERVVTL